MKRAKENPFHYYKILRTKIDNHAHELEKIHSNEMQCKKGCDRCCMDYSIFPIEFYSIVNDLKTNGLKPKTLGNSDKSACIFLKNSVCTIYEHRPIICRTHGLPLLFMNENSEWELSACELNFTQFDFGNFNFENTYPQDKYNSELFLLNKKFISELKTKKYSEFDLIPIRDLIRV